VLLLTKTKQMEHSNELIAEFMGVEEAYNPNGNDFVFKTTIPDINGDTDILESYKVSELKYHTSWDWLMPVIHKCFDVANDCAMQDIMHHLQVAEMGDTYKAVVEFIKDQIVFP